MSLKCMLEGPKANGLEIWQFDLENNFQSLQQRLELPNEDKSVVVALADLKKIRSKFEGSDDWLEHIGALHSICEKRLSEVEKSGSRARKVYRPLRRMVERWSGCVKTMESSNTTSLEHPSSGVFLH
jgi:hypothetical protein